MQAKDEKRDLRYCRYYHGEQQCPYMDAFKGRAWIAEELASERASGSAKDFLSFVAAHIGKWEPYGYEPDVARYIAFSDCCSLEERLEIARGYEIGDALQLQKPQGETVFESFFIGQGFASKIVNKGVLLYPDGNVYIENVDRHDFERANPVYFYVGKYQETADAVKQLIEENWERISALPSKIDDTVCDGGFSYYKFLSKNFDGMIYGGAEESKAVADFHNQVLNIFYRKNTPSIGWLESAAYVDTFVDRWSSLLDEIDADETRAKVCSFIESERFAEDCRVFGFETDASSIPSKELLPACTDYHALGNAIFSKWRYYNHRADDVKAEFDTEWFRLAFERLQRSRSA